MSKVLRLVQITVEHQDCPFFTVFLTIIGSLSKDIFEQQTSTGSVDFSLVICLGAMQFVLLSFFTLIETI